MHERPIGADDVGAERPPTELPPVPGPLPGVPEGDWPEDEPAPANTAVMYPE